ncbi:histidine kinase [Streptomyces sp. NPDC057638]|uniref:histidine kinase n=1 Tax=Streptomyces sp. NPDC057638 TaxID=3346190 RepID=UPI0036A8AA60
MTDQTRSPEFRLVAHVLDGLRQDLVQGAFTYRSFPPIRTDGPLARRFPQPLRQTVVWLPHLAVLGVAFVVWWLAATNYYGPAAIVSGVTGVVVLLSLITPVGAFWLSLCYTPFLSFATGETWGFPWPPVSLVAHVAVMVVAAARTRPRTGAWMWLITATYSVFVSLFLAQGVDGSVGVVLFVSALLLMLVALFHVRREAEQEVAAQQTVTAFERDRRTTLEERTTIARELHDVVAHHMSVVAIQAEAAPYRVENPPPELEAAFATIRENAVAALAELRRILGVVRAEDYEAPNAPQPVLADLDTLLTNVREAGLPVEKTVTGAVRPLPQGVELSAYRIVQEALSNALRHAPGSTAKVEVSYVLGGFGLRIVNTAPQRLVKPSPGAGHGITGMRERVAMLNGEMTADVTEDGGYEVAAFVPVPLAEQDSGPRSRPASPSGPAASPGSVSGTDSASHTGSVSGTDSASRTHPATGTGSDPAPGSGTPSGPDSSTPSGTKET